MADRFPELGINGRDDPGSIRVLCIDGYREAGVSRVMALSKDSPRIDEALESVAEDVRAAGVEQSLASGADAASAANEAAQDTSPPSDPSWIAKAHS